MNFTEIQGFLSIEEIENYYEFATLTKYEQVANKRAFCWNKEITESFDEKFKENPPKIHGYKFSHIHPGFRLYAYEANKDRFPPHEDMGFEMNRKESLMTLLIYLNDDFEGGETVFGDNKIIPKAGNALMFEMKGNTHEGLPVTSGTKYVMKCDIMFEKV